jgi:hypothetical protein
MLRFLGLQKGTSPEGDIDAELNTVLARLRKDWNFSNLDSSHGVIGSCTKRTTKVKYFTVDRYVPGRVGVSELREAERAIWRCSNSKLWLRRE